MKEIIAERDKSFYLYAIVICLIGIIGCIVCLILFPKISWLYIFGLSINGFVILFAVIVLFFPKWVIIKETNNIIIHNGFLRKRTLKITDFVSVRVQDLARLSKGKPNGNIVLTIKHKNSSTKNIVAIGIKNISEVVEKLNSLIQKLN